MRRNEPEQAARGPGEDPGTRSRSQGKPVQGFNLEGQCDQLCVLERAHGPVCRTESRTGTSMCDLSSEAVTSRRGGHFGLGQWHRMKGGVNK